jgi:hypothetical protein
MAAVTSITQIINDELSPTAGSEMAEAFGLKSKKKTKNEDYKFPMQIPYIAKMQDKDKFLMRELMKSDHKYELIKIERTSVLTLNGKIFIPTAIRNPVIDWYHQHLCHPGDTRIEATLRNTMTWPGLTRNIKSFCKTCKLCQFNKKTRKQYGKIPVKMAEVMPWEIVQVDLIGPWKVKTPSGVKTQRCLTSIYTVTSWPERCEITDTISQTVMDAFHNNWICCYPRSIQVTFDNGSEFKSVFKEMCDSLGTTCSPTTSYRLVMATP